LSNRQTLDSFAAAIRNGRIALHSGPSLKGRHMTDQQRGANTVRRDRLRYETPRVKVFIREDLLNLLGPAMNTDAGALSAPTDGFRNFPAAH